MHDRVFDENLRLADRHDPGAGECLDVVGADESVGRVQTAGGQRHGDAEQVGAGENGGDVGGEGDGRVRQRVRGQPVDPRLWVGGQGRCVNENPMTSGCGGLRDSPVDRAGADQAHGHRAGIQVGVRFIDEQRVDDETGDMASVDLGSVDDRDAMGGCAVTVDGRE